MIKYNAIQNKYLYKMEDVDDIIKFIKNINFYNENNCTKENVTILVKKVKDFISQMEIVPENVVLERHETEDEAREYFGDDFISKFDKLLTTLDKQETIVALHGTNIENCPKICENGLMYQLPCLSSTAIQQKMTFGKNEIHYNEYESLLNWCHREYKGLVILAIPYECYYKEGLWNWFRDTNQLVEDYKIDPDFVVGYIDVINKQIILNSKYNRQHNYDGYIKDTELFIKQNNIHSNDEFKRFVITYDTIMNKESVQNSEHLCVEEVDISRIPGKINDLIGTFNSIKNGSPNIMTEERYQFFLEELSYELNDIEKAISFLKSNNDVQKKSEDKFSSLITPQQTMDEADWEFSWNDDFSWDLDTPIEEDEHKKAR